MAIKAKKKRQIPCNEKEDNTAKPWPDLPQPLLIIIGKHSSLMENIRFGGIIKSWRAPPSHCDPMGKKSPWLEQLSNPNIDDYTLRHILNLSFRPGYLRWYFRAPPAKFVVGYSHGELVLINDAPPSRWYLWDPIGRGQCFFPSWDTSIPFKHAVLSTSPHSKNDSTLVIFTGTSHPAFVSCRVGNEEGPWIKQDCTLIDPYGPKQSQRQRNLMQFTNGIGVKGKVYALSLQGSLCVIEGFDSDPRITNLGTTRAVPSVSSRHFREYLIESDGEILLVFLISTKSVSVVDDVEAFRLNLDKLSWVKMESLGDRTMFVGVNCCMCVSADKVGCRRNYVYFTHLNVDGWWVYDMESRSISKSPDWAEPLEEE